MSEIIVTAATAQIVAEVVDKWVTPKIQGLLRGHKERRRLLQASLETGFGDYLERAYHRQSYITTVVFQNQQQLLGDLYVPMTAEGVAKGGRLKIDTYRTDFLPKHKRILLTDTAGMGKSTVLKFLFLECVRENAGLPVFIELRHLTAEVGIEDLLYDELTSLDAGLDKDLVLQLLRRGDFVFFLDGYDEISPLERSPVTRSLQRFIAKAPDNCYLLSSRPEPALASFADFQHFTIKPLRIKEAFDLIRKYSRGTETGERLISKLRGDTLRDLHEFLTNPLLVSLLYKCYDYKPTIPLRKHIFYRQVYDALFESHDLTKGGAYIRDKYSGLDVEDFHRVLRHVGFITFTFGRVDYTKDEILRHIRDAASQCPGVECRAADILRDLTMTVPLLAIEGSEYRWSHKSIQEYFAAQFICVDAKGRQEALLQRMCDSRERLRHINVLDLCYDIDYKTFRRTLIYPLAQRYLVFVERWGNNAKPRSISQRDWLARMQLVYGKRYVLLPPGPAGLDLSIDNFEALQRKAMQHAVTEDEVLTAVQIWPDGSALVVLANPDATLIDLLESKHDPAVTTVNMILPDKEELRDLTPATVLHRKRAISIGGVAGDPIGAKSKFAKVNRLLVSLRPGEPPALDVANCQSLIEDLQIEEERERQLGLLTERL